MKQASAPVTRAPQPSQPSAVPTLAASFPSPGPMLAGLTKSMIR